MKTPMLRAAVVVALTLVTAVASAVPITGSIGFGGSFTVNGSTGDLTTATAFTSFGPSATLGVGTGSYLGVPSFTVPVTFTPFPFSAAGVAPLWSFTHAGRTYSFDAVTVNVAATPHVLVAQGNGIAHISGGSFSPSPGSWLITANNLGANFSFSASTSVPDGGRTALLLGLSLVVLGFATYRPGRFRG